jgi:hypothetical protein
MSRGRMRDPTLPYQGAYGVPSPCWVRTGDDGISMTLADRSPMAMGGAIGCHRGWPHLHGKGTHPDDHRQKVGPMRMRPRWCWLSHSLFSSWPHIYRRAGRGTVHPAFENRFTRKAPR